MLSVTPVFSSPSLAPTAHNADNADNALVELSIHTSRDTKDQHNCPEHFAIKDSAQENCCSDNETTHSCCNTVCSGLYSISNHCIAEHDPIGKLVLIRAINTNAYRSLQQTPFRPPISYLYSA